MAGRNNQRSPMRGQEQGSRGSRYEPYGQDSQNEGGRYANDSFTGSQPPPQGQDWNRQGSPYRQQNQPGGNPSTGPYGMRGSGYGQHDPRAAGDRWEPSGEGYGGAQDFGSSQYGGTPDYGRSQGQGGYGGYGSPQRGYGGSQGDYGATQQGGYGGSQRGWSQSGQAGPQYTQAGSHGAGYGAMHGSSGAPAGYQPQGGPPTSQGYGGPMQGGYGSQQSGQDWGGGQTIGGPQRYYGSSQYGAGSSFGRSYAAPGASTNRSQRRGPKGWVRSDERIKEDLCERIADSDELDASEVIVEVRQGVVTLDGSVSERWMRYSLEDLADSISGVKDVQNNVRIVRAGDATSVGSSGKE